MARKPHAPRIPIIYHSLQDLERPNHDKIEPFRSVAEVLEWEEDLRGEFFGNENRVVRERKTKTNADDRLQEMCARNLPDRNHQFSQ